MTLETHPMPSRAGRRWRFGLESPLLSLPATSIIVGGVFLPLAVLAVYSFWPTVDQQIIHQWTLGNYARFFTVAVYWRVLLTSLTFAVLVSALTVALTFPLAYFVATKVAPETRSIWVTVAVLQFFMSYLIRVFSWMNLLGDGGLINQALISISVIENPLYVVGLNKAGIVITFVYLLAPLAFLTTYISLERANPVLLEAASDLGAGPWKRLWYVTIPLARTGILGGFVMGIITILGDYVTPQLIGGTDGYLYSNIIQLQFGSSVQWGLGAALAFILMIVVFSLLIFLRHVTGGAPQAGAFTRMYTPRSAPILFSYSVVFLAFLYLPVLLLVVLSVNSSTMIGLPFEGFTLHWFVTMLDDPLMVESIENSILVAATAVGISLVLGTVAAVQLARSSSRWSKMSLAIISIPVFLPPMLLGLAMIIGLNALGIDRGLWTIVLGHTVLSLPIVTLLVLIRLEGLDPNLELAAMDLGASPLHAFFWVTVPQALPGIAAAGLITFALSLDEFILTSLVTGADTTLPLYIFGQLRFSVTPSIVAVSVTLLLGSILLVAFGALVSNLGSRKRARASATTFVFDVGR